MKHGIGDRGIYIVVAAFLLCVIAYAVCRNYQITGTSPASQVKAIFTTSDISTPVEIREALGK